MMDDGKSVFMDELDKFRDFVATVTGMRQQLLDEGWTQEHAEELVVAAMRSGG